MKINVKSAKIRSRLIGLTKCHAWPSILGLRVCKNCNNNLLFNKNNLLSSKQNTCENIGTLSESAIAIFSYTCDGHNIRQRAVRGRAWAHQHHPRRALGSYWQLDGGPAPLTTATISAVLTQLHTKATYASEQRCCAASTL